MAYGGGGLGGGYDWQAHNRQVVVEGTRALERTSDSLSRSHQIAIETEQIGTNVLSELGEQREALLRTQDRVENMDDGISRSNRLITAMNRHVLYNKILLIAIIVLESAILGALVYLKFIKK